VEHAVDGQIAASLIKTDCRRLKSGNGRGRGLVSLSRRGKERA